MQKKLFRKDFLRLLLMTNLGLLLKPLRTFATGDPALIEPVSNDHVIYYKKGDAKYEALRKGFNKRIDRFPLIIALCKTVAGISEAVSYAATNKLPVAVKSGGHCMEGFSCNDGGMVINLSLLNKVEWINNDLVKLGPGCTLSGLYDALLPKGKIIPGGSCGGVGVGGLTLGGGYGLLSRRYGLACDSLQEITMVDGTGAIRSSRDDQELLWACRGGGNGNFGIVAEMKFKVHKAPATLQSFRFKSYKITAAKATAVLKKWFSLMEQLPTDCFSAYVLNGKTLYILLTNAGKHSTGLQTIIDGLSAVSDKTTRTKAQPLAPALKVFYGIQHPLYFKNASAGLYKKFSDIENYIDKVAEMVINTKGMIYQVNTLGGKIQDPLFAGASAFPHRDYPYFSELQTYWENEKQAPRLLKAFQEVQNIFNSNGITAQYRNYPDINFNNWDQLYYGKNYSRLQQVKNRYDPHNLIRHDQSIKNV